MNINTTLMTQYLRRIPAYLPTALVLCAILYLSLTADPMPDSRRWLNFPGADKVGHLIMYGGLTGTFCFDYFRRPRNAYSVQVLAFATVVAIAISGVIELLQDSMGLGRTGDWMDVIANACGALLGIVIGTVSMRQWFAP